MTTFGAVARRIRNSAAYRTSGPYRFLLDRWPPPPAKAKQQLDVTYLTFAGAVHRAMLRESIASIANSWEWLPQLRVVTDGTMTGQEVRRVLRFWPSEIAVYDWRELAAKLDATPYDSIVQFAHRVPMARKMVAVVTSALEAPTLYSDVDVLWFAAPDTLLTGSVTRKPQMIMSPDFQPMYDSTLVPGVLPHLAHPPFYCAGILFAHGDVLAGEKVRELLAYAADRGVAVTEQTIFAEANYELGRAAFEESEFALFDGDRFSLGPSFRAQKWVARHYIGQVRHIFWRDALALRMGLGKLARRSVRHASL